jgi:hypothetical protein
MSATSINQETMSTAESLFCYNYRVILPNMFLALIRESHSIVHRVYCFGFDPEGIAAQRETRFDAELVLRVNSELPVLRHSYDRHTFEYVVPTPPNVSRRQAVTLISQLIERSNDFHHVFLEDVELIDGRAILSFGS